MALKRPRVTMKLYNSVLIVFFVIGAVVTPLTIQGIAPAYVGYVLFALVVSWFVFDPRLRKKRE